MTSKSNFTFDGFAEELKNSAEHRGKAQRGPPPGFEKQPPIWSSGKKKKGIESIGVKSNGLSGKHQPLFNSTEKTKNLSKKRSNSPAQSKSTNQHVSSAASAEEKNAMFQNILAQKSKGFMMPGGNSQEGRKESGSKNNFGVPGFQSVGSPNPMMNWMNMMSAQQGAGVPSMSNPMCSPPSGSTASNPMANMMAGMNPMMGMMAGPNQMAWWSMMQMMMQNAAAMTNMQQNMSQFMQQTKPGASNDVPTRQAASRLQKNNSVQDQKTTNETESLNSEDEQDDATDVVVAQADEINCTTRLIERLHLELEVNKYGPFVAPKYAARYFIIKSFTEEDVHRAVKYKLWCSTYYGNRRLESAWDHVKAQDGDNGHIYLFFSVNASGHFCGVAKMASKYENDDTSADIWSKDEHNEGGKNSKWRGQFAIEWVYIKDIPNGEFSHLKVQKNGNKPFPHSRDTQEIEEAVAVKALDIFHKHSHKTSLLDDFDHYNRIEEKQHAKDKQSSYKFHNRRIDSYNRRGSNSNRSNKTSTSNRRNSKSSSKPAQPEQPVTTRDEEASNGSDGVFEDNIPGVLTQLRPASVSKIIGASKNQRKPREQQEDDLQMSLERQLRKAGQPGPRAIPIVKPKIEDGCDDDKENAGRKTPEGGAESKVKHEVKHGNDNVENQDEEQANTSGVSSENDPLVPATVDASILRKISERSNAIHVSDGQKKQKGKPKFVNQADEDKENIV